ncbi:MAG TPA: TolC family protein [Gemmatimonadaceae bacterium]|nr:TolC family protein [Gemmatimonadaceae bacterium]
MTPVLISRTIRFATAASFAVGALLWCATAHAQMGRPGLQQHGLQPVVHRAADLDSLLALALANSPHVAAAAHRLTAARARIGPAGARPDPMLMAGVLDFPYQRAGYGDNFTMNMVRLTQTLPYPGKLTLATQAAHDDESAASATLDQARLDVVRDVKTAYYELAFVRRARDIVQRNSTVLASLVAISQARYQVGTATQSDALRARIEAAHLGDQEAALDAEERAALARLNALLDRPSDTPVDSAAVPPRIAGLAVADSAEHVHFTSTALGAAPANSPMLGIDSLTALALSHSPMLRAHDARIAAQERRLALAEKAHLPDFDVSLEYDQRPHFSDYVSFFVSVPLRLQHGRKQDQEVDEARAELDALHAEHVAQVNTIRGQIASLAADAQRERTELALSLKAVLPEARAALASATASYDVGRIDFPSLVDAQAMLFTEETAYARALTDFATTIAQLESVVGAEVVK